MPIELHVIVWAFLLVNAIAFAYWVMVAARVERICRNRPTVRSGLGLPDPDAGRHPRVSVVVPVHNEQRVVDACCRSLRAQTWPDLELIFVLDRCTDGTREILVRHAAEDERVIVVENDGCPEGWAGKCNAARLGAERATGDWLLFTDADTEFDPQLIRAAVALAGECRLDLLSLLSSLTYERPHERIAQPVASMNLVRLYPIERVNRDEQPRPFANGQFMIFRREMYDRIGGHAAVRDDLLEDIAFARLVHRAGGRGGVFFADGMLTCSMYDSLEAFRRGWKRIFIEACKRKPQRLRKNGLRVLTLGVACPLFQLISLVAVAMLVTRGHVLAAGLLGSVVVAGVLVQAFAVLRANSLGGAPLRSALLFPVGSWVVGRIMLEGARDLTERRPITWAGKTYLLEPR